MSAKSTFPIRMKILLTLLLVVTGVVSLITWSMAGMFHEDKKTYIHDLTSLIAISASEECKSLLGGYKDRLRVYGNTMTSGALAPAARNELLETHFQEFPDLVGLVLYEQGEERASVFDRNGLQAVGLTKEDIHKHLADRPIPFDELRDGEPFVENRTLTEELPMLALATSLGSTEGGVSRTVLALLRLDSLQRLSSRSDVFEVVVVDRNSVLLAHPDAALLRRPTEFPLPPSVRDLRFGAGVTVEFEENGVEMIGGFASPDFGGVTTGVRIPRSAAFIASREVLNHLIVVAFALLLAAAIIGVVGSRRITRPLGLLVEATHQVGRGEFDIQVRVDAHDEIGALSTSFNQMAAELNTREQALQETQTQLIQSEKMAAFGQLGAGVAHEVKNPLAGILGCAQLSLRKVEDGTAVHRNLTLIEKETRRCKTIVENLLRFARQEKAILESTQVNPVVEDAVAIVGHQLELNRVKLSTELGEDLPPIDANANQLQQVVVNLIINAQQAIDEDGGKVIVSTRRADSGGVEICVADDGPGVPHEMQASIFEPFFTTKPGGKGTGLGLSVSYGIVKDHGGEIALESEPGQGARFRMTFPPREPSKPPREEPAEAQPESTEAGPAGVR